MVEGMAQRSDIVDGSISDTTDFLTNSSEQASYLRPCVLVHQAVKFVPAGYIADWDETL